MFNLGSSNSCTFVFNNTPNGFHHSNEVEIVSDAHRQVSVVVNPFVVRDSSISIASNSFERVKEGTQDFFSGHLSIEEVLVLSNVINVCNVLNGYGT